MGISLFYVGIYLLSASFSFTVRTFIDLTKAPN